MDLSTVGGWLVTALILAVQGTMVYGAVRLLRVGGGIQLPNPFRKGWGDLYAAYGSATGMQPMPSSSARIGAVTYKNSVAIGWGENELFLRRSFFSEQLVRIPYAHFTVTKRPQRTTILRIPVHTDGLFLVDGVEIALPTEVAHKLIAQVALPDSSLI